MFSKISDFSQIFDKNLDFGQSFRKISISVKISRNFDFSQFSKKISILFKIFEYFRF